MPWERQYGTAARGASRLIFFFFFSYFLASPKKIPLHSIPFHPSTPSSRGIWFHAILSFTLNHIPFMPCSTLCGRYLHHFPRITNNTFFFPISPPEVVQYCA